MNNRRTTKLFFIELTFVLLGFAICCSVCVQLFAKAHQKSSLSRDTAAAVVSAQTAAECFKAVPNDEKQLASLLGADGDGHTVTVYYNESWETVTNHTNRVLIMEIDQNVLLRSADITVSLNDQVLFELTVYRALTSGGDGP